MEVLNAFARHTGLSDQEASVVAKKWLLCNVGTPVDYKLAAGADYDLIKATTCDPPLETYRTSPVDPALFVDVMKNSFQKGEKITSAGFRRFCDALFPEQKVGDAWAEHNNEHYWKPRAYYVALTKPNMQQLAREIFRSDLPAPADAVATRLEESALVKKMEAYKASPVPGDMAAVLSSMNYVPLVEEEQQGAEDELPIEHQAFGDSNVEEGVAVFVPAQPAQPPQWVDASHPTLQSFRRKGLINAVASPKRIFQQMLLSIGRVESNADVMIGKQRRIPPPEDNTWDFVKDKICIAQGAIDRSSKEFKELPKEIRELQSDTQVIASVLQKIHADKTASPLSKAFIDAIVRGQQ